MAIPFSPPGPGQAPLPPRPPRPQAVHKTRNGGGFNVKPVVNVNLTKTAPEPRGGRPGGGQKGAGVPGSEFNSNDDIRAFSEHLRKTARQRAVERSLDAAQLEAVLRNIPDASGSMAGARARARRVSRHLKLIAAAEKAIAKWATALFAQFEREFESELRKVGKARTQQQPRPFDWG
ncbi:plasmid transfer protein TraA [Streptomyces sp. URMC 124]|uniref:plasmid transfer protein TraA n=1 Tax=Streptomyces sp. URMC 124 TaxID=3423405 RepID=UPI003F1A1A3B